MMTKALYLCKRSRPDIQTAVPFLTTRVKAPDLDDWKKLVKMIGYLKGKENHSIRYRTPTEMKSISFFDDNYATNMGDRRSVTGMVNTIGNMITNWASKTQATVSLSISEAEYIALSICAQESVLQSNLLNELGETNCYPAEVLEDNSGAIFLMKKTNK